MQSHHHLFAFVMFVMFVLGVVAGACGLAALVMRAERIEDWRPAATLGALCLLMAVAIIPVAP